MTFLTESGASIVAFGWPALETGPVFFEVSQYQVLKRFNLKALLNTQMLDAAMASAANIGDSRMPMTG